MQQYCVRIWGGDVTPSGSFGTANPTVFAVRRQRGVVRSTFGAELHGLVDIIEQVSLFRFTLHPLHIYIYIYIYTHCKRFALPAGPGYQVS